MPPAAEGLVATAPAPARPVGNGASASLPLLDAVRAEFQDIAQLAGGTTVGAEDIAKHWERLADADLYIRGRPRLTAQQKQAIALRVAQVMQEVDLLRTGRISVEEWVHYMLMMRSGFATKQVNALLDKALQKNSSILQDLQKMFEAADSTSSGVLSFKEIVAMYSRKLWYLLPSPSGAARNLSEEELGAGDPEEFARTVLQAMDINGDERVSYAEFMAYSLGRRKHEVLLHLYDLSNGAAEALSPWLFGKTLDGIWHTGVVVFGKEYYYSKDTVYADAGDTSFGKPTRVIQLGFTLWRQDELHEFVTNELKPIFQRDTYDVVTNNCNHFSDRVSMYLVGKHLPTEVLEQPDLLLRARSVRLVRPMLNWWLRDRIVVREKGVALPASQQRLKPGERAPLGMIVTIHPPGGSGPTVLGQVISAEGRDREDTEPMVVGGGVGKEMSSNGPGCETAGCGSLWSSTCGAVVRSAVSTASAGSGQDGIWVHYFDIAMGSANSPGRAQVKCEQIPASRLSAGGLHEEGEVLYTRALKTLLGSSSASGTPRSLRTGRAMAPNPVQVASIAEVEETVQSAFPEMSSL